MIFRKEGFSNQLIAGFLKRKLKLRHDSCALKKMIYMRAQEKQKHNISLTFNEIGLN